MKFPSCLPRPYSPLLGPSPLWQCALKSPQPDPWSKCGPIQIRFILRRVAIGNEANVAVVVRRKDSKKDDTAWFDYITRAQIAVPSIACCLCQSASSCGNIPWRHVPFFVPD
jgi:hypothetical protein